MALFDMKAPKRSRRWLVIAAVLAVGWLAQQAGIDLSALGRGEGSDASGIVVQSPSPARSSADPARAPSGSSTSQAAERIGRAAAGRESGFMVTVEGTVVKTLRDDNEGSRHQRFLIEIESGQTLLVAHNIDLAKRVPLDESDTVLVRGQYEWNDRGGVLHWTHHDPDGSHPGGWIEHRGVRVE